MAKRGSGDGESCPREVAPGPESSGSVDSDPSVWCLAQRMCTIWGPDPEAVDPMLFPTCSGSSVSRDLRRMQG